MTAPIASAATQSIATITFGILATLIGVLALWQAPRAFRRLYGQLSERQAESDLESQTSEAVELEARQIFELPSTPIPRSQLSTTATSAVLEEARLLDPVPLSAPTTAPATTTISPA